MTIDIRVIFSFAVIIICVQQMIIFWMTKKMQDKQDDLMDRLSAKNTSEYAELIAFRRKIASGKTEKDDNPEPVYDERGVLVSGEDLSDRRDIEDVIGVM